MTSRERVLAAIAHGSPDRVPVDYVANEGINTRLKRHFGLLPGDQEGLLSALGVDLRGFWPSYKGPPHHAAPEGVRVNEWGVHRRWIAHPSGGYWDFCDFPLRNATPDQMDSWQVPSPDAYDYSGVPAWCARHAGKALVLGHAGVGDCINNTGMVRTMEQVLVDLATDDPSYLRYLDRRLATQIEVAARCLEVAGGRFDLFCMGEDLGTQKSPMISMELYRRHLRPRHQRIINLAKEWRLPVMFHSCGSSSWVYEDLIEMGVQVIDTLQPEAVNMAPAYLKQRFGDRLAFHGCISTAGPLACGTTADVERNVRETLEAMMPGGGYLLAPTHAIQDNSPTENVLAMYDAARRFGSYGS